MEHSREETGDDPTPKVPAKDGWEEVGRGPTTLRVESMERPLPSAPEGDDEPKPRPNVHVKTSLMERPAPREDAAGARKAGQRPDLRRRIALMERRPGGDRGGPPSIGSMDPSRRA